MIYTLREIAEITGGDLRGPSSGMISRISIDSRTIGQPDGLLFLAIRGERHDGHRFVSDLLDRGVRAFMVQELPEDYRIAQSANGGKSASAKGQDTSAAVTFILVKDPLEALHALAAHHRIGSSAEVVGITGSNGKTIVKEWIHQVLSADLNLVRSPKSYNSQVGVPLSVLLLEDDTSLAVFEAGISRPGEMEKLQRIIKPDLGIFTNIGEAHQEGFPDRELKIREKLRLFESCKTIIYCSDQDQVHRLIRDRFPSESLFSWSFGEEGDVRITRGQDKDGEEVYRVRHGNMEMELNLPFGDRASVENTMHVIALMIFRGMDPLVIASRIADLAPVAMRMEMVKGINSCTLINDTYNSDLVSLSIAMDYLNQQNQHSMKTLILSDIMQTGKQSRELYGEVAALLRKKNIIRFFGIGPEIYGQRALFGEGSRFFQTTSDFLASAGTIEFRNEAILIKGSRVFTFEKITQRLQEKNHRTVLEIDMNALIHNLNVYRSMTDAKIMVMVKAFSYGSGSMEIANVLQYQKVDYLCVAYVDEGIILREAGIHLPVLVMNPEVSGFDLMIDHNLEPEIYNFRSLFSFIEAIRKRNLGSYPVHLKLETGMNRLGFREEELDQLFEVLRRHPDINIRSVFSHLVAAEEQVHDAFTAGQIETFERMSGRILQEFPGNAFRHLLNSAGIERFPEASFDMVRLGIGLYGISQTMGNRLQAVSSLKSIISQVKPVSKGKSVGYGRSYRADRDMMIGIVPVGYADGLRRDLGERGGTFLVKGKEVPILGTLCMDMCMVDLSGTGAEEGDEVIIFGPEKPVAELAEKLGTITYEILAGLSERVKRAYFRE